MSSFWSESANSDTKDPKRNFRFEVIFTGLSTGKVWVAKKVGKPNFTVTESEHVFFNHKYYYPGRVEWQPVTLTLVDPVDTSMTTGAQMAALAEAAGYVIPTGPGDTLKSMTKGKAASSLGSIQIMQLDGEGVAIETWTLHNPFIKSFKWGDLDYSSDDITEMEMEIRYDWADLETSTNSVATVPSSVSAKKEFFKTDASSPSDTEQ